MSSSGFVPSPSSKRDLNEYWPWKTPSPTVSSPEPPCRSPRHSALPLRVAMPPPSVSWAVGGGPIVARADRPRPLGRAGTGGGPRRGHGSLSGGRVAATGEKFAGEAAAQRERWV